MDAAFELYDKVNHWNRTKITTPTTPLLPSSPLAPFDIVTAIYNSKPLDATVELFPNPAKDVATLKIVSKTNKNINVKMVDIATGKIIKNLFSGDINNTKFLHLDIGDIPNGTILLLITSGDERLFKLVIAK